MIIVSWNIRGFSKPLRRKEVLQKCNKLKVDAFCIMERKLRRNKIARSLRIFYDEWEWKENVQNNRARMIMFWRRKTINMSILSIEE